MKKQHPESVMLIEKMPGGYEWQIVARQTTEHGLSHGCRPKQDHIGELRRARRIFDALKTGADHYHLTP